MFGASCQPAPMPVYYGLLSSLQSLHLAGAYLMTPHDNNDSGSRRGGLVLRQKMAPRPTDIIS